jgi:WD40 repeat protein
VPEIAPLIFLSHSGADSDAARDLKRRLLTAPDARAAGLKVWFDKDDLRPGGQWQPQIEQAIGSATAFVVYVGSKGVMNWVEAEVRVALSRANTDKSFLFIPALAGDSAGSSALPSFAKLYQGVHDPLGDGEELAKLLKAVIKSDWDKAARLIDEPFVGLRSMREEEADRFFGREEQVKELLAKFGKHRIVAIVADSGTGKSSLAEAGFIPAFRGGALADPSRSEPDDRVWNVISMRPGSNPEEGLRTGVSEAAQKLGLSVGDQSSLRKLVTVGDPSETEFGLQCDLPARKTATLLIVDQFEELFTATPDALVAPFVKMLLDLTDGDKDFRILLTVRADYFNLVSDVRDAAEEAIRGTDGRTLFERLDVGSGEAILRLKRISEEGLRDAILKPLRLAGESGDQTALIKAVQRDISDQPSDLPLLQVALRAAWRERRSAGHGLVEAYHSVGGVLGALAREAENVRAKLSADDQARLESIFVRLVRLGDTGGATRRTASLDEFDEARRELVQQLGREEYGRLVAVSEKSAEIAHEALITQWPWLQGQLKSDARNVRRLERLVEKSREWKEAPKKRKTAYVARGAERGTFEELAKQRPNWLSRLEHAFVETSIETHRAEIDARRAEVERRQREREETLARALRNESVALTALANIEAPKRPVNAAKLALAAWPRDGDDTMTPRLKETLDALGEIVPYLRGRLSISGHEGPVVSAAFSPDGTRVVTSSDDNTARVWNAASGREIAALRGHERKVNSAAFSPDGTRVVTSSDDKTARVWNAASGREIAALRGHERKISSVAFSPDGTRVVTASLGGTARTARLWDAVSGREIAEFKGHEELIYSAAFSPDGTHVITASRDKTARLWDAGSGREIATLRGHDGRVYFAIFSPDGARILTASSDSTARLWDASSGRELVALRGHERTVRSAAFGPDGTRVVTASSDNTARLWDAVSGSEIAELKGHREPVRSAAFSPDGTRVVTASNDNTARLWDAATGREVATLAGHTDAVLSAAFNLDGKLVVTASFDGTARLWDALTIPQGNILQLACALLRLREDPVSLEGVTDYPLTFDRPICVTDPPPPDLMAEPAAPQSRR